MSAQPVLQQLLAAAEHEGEDLVDRINEVPIAERLQLGAAARASANAFSEEGDAVHAEAAFRLAMGLYESVEAWPETIEAGVRCADVMKYRAETVEAFEMARLFAVGLTGPARHVRLPDLLFSAHRVAADSAYFAAQTCGQQGDLASREDWLLKSTRDAVAALDVFEVGVATIHGGAFVSLLAALAGELSQQHWSSQGLDTEIQDDLRRIALCVESLAPMLDSDEGIQLALTLGPLSYRCGSPNSGRARLTAAIDHARRSDDVAGFMRTSAARYEGERASYRPSTALHELRTDFWDGADVFRQIPRSRAGRLYAAQQLDAMSGSMTIDCFSRLVARDLDEALRAVEINRARTLLDELAHATRPPPAEEAATALSLEARVLHLEAAPGPDAGVRREVQLVSRLPVGGLEADPARGAVLAELESLYAAHDAGFTGQGEVTSLDEVIAALEDGEAIIEYHVPYDALDPAHSLLFLVITTDGVLALHEPLISEDADFTGRIQVDGREPVDASPLGGIILEARVAIQSGDDVAAATYLETLYSVLVDPLVGCGIEPASFRRLIVVPHGILHAVPFAALRSPTGRYLVQDVAITVAPSASVWHRLQACGASAPQSLLGFADPDLGPGWDPLSDARGELADVKKLLQGVDCTVHAGSDATEEVLRREATGKHILHFATHGEFPEADVMNMHRILLAAAGDDDGRVHAEELRKLDLSAAVLTVLSICDGALYRFGPGDEPYGLISALLAAGVTNVVGPAWAIDDRLGRMLVVEMYRSLLEEGPAEALRRAALTALEGGAAIRDWAGFVLVGTGRPFIKATGQGGEA